MSSNSNKVVEKASKIVAAIDNHLDNDCLHCKALLKELYKVEE